MRNVLAWKTSLVCIHNVQILGTPQESNGWIHRFTALVHISSLWWILYVISLVIYVEKRWEQPLMISGMTQVCCERFLFKKRFLCKLNTNLVDSVENITDSLNYRCYFQNLLFSLNWTVFYLRKLPTDN